MCWSKNRHLRAKSELFHWCRGRAAGAGALSRGRRQGRHHAQRTRADGRFSLSGSKGTRGERDEKDVLWARALYLEDAQTGERVLLCIVDLLSASLFLGAAQRARPGWRVSDRLLAASSGHRLRALRSVRPGAARTRVNVPAPCARRLAPGAPPARRSPARGPRRHPSCARWRAEPPRQTGAHPSAR